MTEFHVRVIDEGEGKEDWWTVEISYGQEEFARVQAKDVNTAMRMAVPYMVCASEPDPFAGLLP